MEDGSENLPVEISVEVQKAVHDSRGGGKEDCFRPGTIHSPRAVKFWAEELKAGEWVMDTLQNGYTIPLEQAPPAEYEEENNQSAKRDMKFVRETVRKWAELGIVKLVQSKPRIVSPLTVVERKQPNGEVKKRLCWDGSRCINRLLKKQHVSLAHLQKALEITEPNDLQSKYDLKSAYFHIKICEQQTHLLGAKFMDEKGQPRYFTFQHLPFGLASAVHVITKLFKPINAFLGARGIRHSIFIDDGRMLAKNTEQSERDFAFVKDTLEKAGWQMENSKTDPTDGGSKTKEYLGFEIDTEQMEGRMTDFKKDQLIRALEEVISSEHRYIPVKFLATVVGKLIASEPALGPVVQIMLRRTYHQMETHVERKGWSSNIQVSSEMVEDAVVLKRETEGSAGYPIRTEATALSVVALVTMGNNSSL